MPFEVIGDPQLEAGLQGFHVLVLPASICLTLKEKESIRAFLSDGGGVVCTWATGARDEAGKWQGTEFLEEITGAETFDFTSRPPPWYVSFMSRRPTTAGGPAGYRAQVYSPDRMEAKSFGADAYWSDSNLQPVDSSNPTDFQGVLIHNSFRQGRVVWLGFQENSAVAAGNNKAIIDRVLTNALLWAGQQPIVEVNPWPTGYSAAAVFACDVANEANNAIYVADTLRRARARGTFFCVPRLVKGNGNLIRQILGAGEVASQSDTHRLDGSGGPLTELFRVESSKWNLWRAANAVPNGLQLSSGRLSDSTLVALSGARYKYLLSSLDSGTPADSVLPDIFEVSQSLGWLRRRTSIVELNRTTADDLHYSPLGVVGLDPSYINERTLGDFEIIKGLGGLYILNFHTQGFGAPAYVASLATMADHFNNEATWIATAQEVADWWLKESHLSLALTAPSTQGVSLILKYDGTTPLENVTLGVYLAAQFTHAHVLPVDGGPTASVNPVANSDGQLTIRLGRIPPKTATTYALTWVK